MTLTQTYGNWALVTGASSGIGEAFAVHLAEQGFDLVLLARREDRLNALADRLRQTYEISTRVTVIDLAERDFMDKLCPQIEDIEIGLLVNNAGFGAFGEFLHMDLHMQQDMLSVNVFAPVVLAHTFGKQMLRRGRGAIIFVASSVGFMSVPYAANYAATKAHLLSFGDSLAHELRDTPVDVLTVCPGFTETEGLHTAFANKREETRTPPMGDVTSVVRDSLTSLGRKSVTVTGFPAKGLVVLTSKLLPWQRATRFMGALPRISEGRPTAESPSSAHNNHKTPLLRGVFAYRRGAIGRFTAGDHNRS